MKHTSNFFSKFSVRGIGWLALSLSFSVILACCGSETAQTTAFTYQGKLADNNGGEKVMPELVIEDGQGYKAVNNSALPLLTLQAVKELQQGNEALKKENAAIKQQQAQFAIQQTQIVAQQAQLSEQVRRIQTQKREIERQQQQSMLQHQTLEALKRLVCSSHRQSETCK